VKPSIRFAAAVLAIAIATSAVAATTGPGGIPGILARAMGSIRAAVLCYPMAFSLLDGPHGSGRCRDAGVSPR
jgi:hypothetical protein